MTANPDVHPGTLSCGCRRGHYLCPEGDRLWHEVGRAYDSRDHDAYNTALAEYERHYEEAR